MLIYYNRFDDTLEYAISELKRCVERMSGYTLFPTDRHVPTLPTENVDGVIRLGLLSDFGLPTDGVTDAYIDDVIDIDIVGDTGYIAGSNIRSILLGIYRWLRSCGARWPRPGDDGEYLPYCDFASKSFKYRHAATHRYRGECIEGAVSYEHVRDTIKWLPKVGGNMFFMEQVIPYNYISRWYDRTYNPNKPNDKREFEMVGEYTRQLEMLIRHCGLQLHALGHGFMLEPYGIHYRTGRDKYDLSEYGKSHTALVKGERGLFHGSPNFTQLCFSNEEARHGMVNFLCEYLERKPYIDFLHVWLADAQNNHCECENCQKKIPSDWYVMVLNELDAALTERGLDTRIIFILYNDTVFPPETEKIKNQSRFILLTAFTRDRSKAMEKKLYDGELPKYRRNDFNVPSDFSINYTFLEKWREHFKGDAFIYEYYFYTDHFNDPGYMGLSNVLVEDVRMLKTLGFQGIVSDQTQRSFYPNGLPLSVLMEALYDEDIDLEAYTADYVNAAYGDKYGAAAGEYLKKVSELFDAPTLRTTTSVVEEDTGLHVKKIIKPWVNNPEYAAKVAMIPSLAESFMPTIDAALSSELDACHRRSWYYLKLHAGYIAKLADALKASAEGEAEKAKALYNELVETLRNDEDEWAKDFDLCLFIQRTGAKFN